MHSWNKVHLCCCGILAFSCFGFSQSSSIASTDAGTSCAPPTYDCARQDLVKTNNLNPVPSMSGGKNTIVTPSDFKLPIVRATDSTSYENQTMAVTFSGSNGDNIFNTNDTYLIVNSDGAWRYPLAFDPANMKVLNTSPWTLGSNQVRWTGPSSFSRVNPDIAYAVPQPNTKIAGMNGNYTRLYKILLSGTTSIKATASEVFDFATCGSMANPYSTGGSVWHSTLTVSAGDKRYSLGFSRKGDQDTGTDVVVYDAPSGKCYHYDTAHARLCTASGCEPMSLPDEFTIHAVYMSLDGNYVRITFYNCMSGGCKEGQNSNPYIWEVGTTNVTRCYNSSHTANCNGHMVEGYTHLYNGTDWPQTGKRAFSDPLSYSVVNTTPPLLPRSDAHYSNNAADANDTHPYWVTTIQNVRTAFGGAGCNKTGNLYEGCTFPGPLYGEIFGITQRGGYIRAAHSYNSGSSKNFNCQNTIGAVSQTGKFFAWTSDWLTTLGKDHTGANRCDVFIVNLAAPQGATN